MRPNKNGVTQMPQAAEMLVPLRRDGLDPVPDLSHIRAQQPVCQLHIPGGPTAWLVTRYSDVCTVLGDAARFSTDFNHLRAFGGQLGSRQKAPGGLGFCDPPDHTHLRHLLTPYFTRERLQELTPFIKGVVTDRLNAVETAGRPSDLVSAFAVPLPWLVICEFLGIPHADRAGFLSVSTSRFDLSKGPATALNTIADSLAYGAELIARQRRAPGPGVLGSLLREHGDDIDDPTLAGLLDGLMTGGFETTAGMLALGALLLLQNPTSFALMRDGQDDHISSIVEEMLRYLSVVQVAFTRFAREDLILSEQRITAGDMIICSLSSANRDPALGMDMDRFDPVRHVHSHHIAFGHGIHFCLGAALARLQMCLAYPALIKRFPTLRLAVAAEELQFRTVAIVYGITSLPVTW